MPARPVRVRNLMLSVRLTRWTTPGRYHHSDGRFDYRLRGEGPGEALVSTLGVTGGNKKSGSMKMACAKTVWTTTI